MEFLPDCGHAVSSIRRNNEQTTASEPYIGLQDPMGKWIDGVIGRRLVDS